MSTLAEKIASLDFSGINERLVVRFGWLKSEADECEVQYRRFLYLCGAYPNESLVPSHDIDEFWHAHVLDTRKYIADCDLVFGKYLHHNPGLTVDEATGDGFKRTQELYQENFGEGLGVAIRPTGAIRKFLKYVLLRRLF